MKPFIFRFGQSIAHSGPSPKENFKISVAFYRSGRSLPREAGDFEQERQAPSAYDVLAALQKSDPETFEDFCSNYEYDQDSRKAEKVYFAVQKEHKEVRRLFNDVMDRFWEIQ